MEPIITYIASRIVVGVRAAAMVIVALPIVDRLVDALEWLYAKGILVVIGKILLFLTALFLLGSILTMKP